MTTIAEDILSFLEKGGYGQRRVTLFTPADKGAYDVRPLTVIANEARPVASPDVTVDADRCMINLTFAGTYGPTGEARVFDFAHQVYLALRLVLHETINGTEYLCIQAQSPPAHDGYDEDGRTIYSISLEIYRALSEAA